MRLTYSCLLVGISFAISSPDLSAADPVEKDLREVVSNYSADRGDLAREYDVPDSPDRAARFKQFYSQWQYKLAEIPFDDLSQAGKIDYLLLANHIGRQVRQLDLDQEAAKEIEPLAPFLSAIAELETARRRFEFADGQAAATKLSEINTRVAEVRAKMEKLVGQEDLPDLPKKTLGRRRFGHHHGFAHAAKLVRVLLRVRSGRRLVDRMRRTKNWMRVSAIMRSSCGKRWRG